MDIARGPPILVLNLLNGEIKSSGDGEHPFGSGPHPLIDRELLSSY